MKIVPKSAQELSAQVLDVYPHFSDYAMSAEQATSLDKQAKELRDKVRTLEPYTQSDEELNPILTEIEEQAKQSGVWQPTEGQESEKRVAHATNRLREYGYSEEVAAIKSLRDLENSGYLKALRNKRYEQERLFKDPLDKYIKAHVLNSDAERKQITLLLERTIDITTVMPEELDKLSQEFPSGNFLYHGSGTEQLIKIIDSGALVNAKALNIAKPEDHNGGQIVKRNSGYEGISWSLNGLDALPGDRYHLAGFVASPETVLKNNEQLAIPSRPAPNEVLQISSNLKVAEFYDAKTQFELYCDRGVLGETNSVFGNLFAIAMHKKGGDHQLQGEPMLYKMGRDFLNEPNYQKKLRDFYTIDDGGKIRLSPDLLQQPDNEIPVAAVWLQAIIDTGRLKETQFANQELQDIIDSINSENVKDLLDLSQQDWQTHEQTLNETEKIVDNIKVPLENMWFVAPRKDTDMWLRVFARSQHKPAGILLYDDEKVRLENFASLHKGDHTELTHELQKAIKPDNDKYIEYSDVLGTEFTNDKRTGNKHQVIAERYLTNRGSIININDKLIVERK